MLDITVSYCHLGLQLFPRLLSKTSKQKHLARLQEVSIHRLHIWLPAQEGWWDPLKWRLSPGGRGLSRKREDGGMEGGRKRQGKEEQSSLLPPPCFPSSPLSWYSRLLPPTMLSHGYKVLYRPQEQALRETQNCFKNQGWPKAAQAPA